MYSVESALQTETTKSESTVYSDLAQLTKPRISVMVLMTVAVAGLLAAAGTPNLWMVLHVTIGVLFVSASGSAMNQYLERYTDFLMPRTRYRPLPNHRLSANQVATFGAVTLGIGLAYLFAVVSWQAAFLGIVTWFLYVVIYTPMKTRTWLNTAVGAVAGAMPILIGAVGTSGTINGLVWVFFSVLFMWQFPHFMAIAWLYRADYTEGGMQMATVTDPTGRLAGWHAVLFSIALIPTTLITVLMIDSVAGQWIIGGVSLVIGLAYLVASLVFHFRMDDKSARRLLRVSLLHLPLFMLALVVAVCIG